MTDKELLELAAKAAGAEITGRKGNEPIYSIEREIEPGEYEYTRWNPLEKSPSGRSDCLQMEIDLKLTVVWDPMKSEWCIGGVIQNEFKWLSIHENRQRASTMAAAEIGRGM